MDASLRALDGRIETSLSLWSQARLACTQTSGIHHPGYFE